MPDRRRVRHEARAAPSRRRSRRASQSSGWHSRSPGNASSRVLHSLLEARRERVCKGGRGRRTERPCPSLLVQERRGGPGNVGHGREVAVHARAREGPARCHSLAGGGRAPPCAPILAARSPAVPRQFAAAALPSCSVEIGGGRWPPGRRRPGASPEAGEGWGRRDCRRTTTPPISPRPTGPRRLDEGVTPDITTISF